MLNRASIISSLFLCFVSGSAERNVTRIIYVTNGGFFGTWGEAQFCPPGTYATGFNMKIEWYQQGGDVSKLNAVRLTCTSLYTSQLGGFVQSTTRPWGSWVGGIGCASRNGTPFFLNAFALRVVEPWKSNNYDTSANYVKFKCRDFEGSQEEYVIERPQGGLTLFGNYGGWSQSCPANSAICGIKTMVHPQQGDGDETALNDIELYCCSIDGTGK